MRFIYYLSRLIVIQIFLKKCQFTIGVRYGAYTVQKSDPLLFQKFKHNYIALFCRLNEIFNFKLFGNRFKIFNLKNCRKLQLNAIQKRKLN